MARAVKRTGAIKSFSVASKIPAASPLTKSYPVEGLPALVINGKYAIAFETAKGEIPALKVVDWR